MKNTNWREIVEILGIVSIVAALLLVALELRTANQISRAALEIELIRENHEISSLRLTDPSFAQLFAKLESPEGHLITATDSSRAQALAQHLGSVYLIAQRAHDAGLLSAADYAHYQRELIWNLERWPLVGEQLQKIYDASPRIQEAAIFAPLDAAAASRAGD